MRDTGTDRQIKALSLCPRERDRHNVKGFVSAPDMRDTDKHVKGFVPEGQGQGHPILKYRLSVPPSRGKERRL